MNRLLTVLLIPLIAASVTAGASGAQPRALDELDARLAGYPALTIRLTEERIEAPAAAPAGRTLLVEENATAVPGHAFVLRIPDDVTEAAVTEALAGPAAVEETPEWFWRSEFLGIGDYAAPGGSAVSLADLVPGRYLAGDPFRSPAEFARFEVTGEAEQTAGNPDADVTAKLYEMSIALPDTVAAGRQVWEITNTGAMLHEIAILPVPAKATTADVETAVAAALQAEMTGDAGKAGAAIDALGEEWAGWSGETAAGLGVLSPRRVAWTQFDLEPGTYAAVCYVPEPTTGTPHLMLGMTEVFTVEAPSA